MRFETTLNHSVNFSGVGLHSGVPVNMRVSPGPSVDGNRIRAHGPREFSHTGQLKHVARVSYATSLMRQGVLISTTEHLLSALYSMGIDNAFIQMDNLEVPIMDGSGLPFIKAIREAGIRTYRRRRKYLRIRRPVSVEAPGKRITILPSDCFLLTCDIFFDHPLVGHQTLEMEVTPERYATDIAPARTFGFAWELDQMRNMGLIRGASLDSRCALAAKRS